MSAGKFQNVAKINSIRGQYRKSGGLAGRGWGAGWGWVYLFTPGLFGYCHNLSERQDSSLVSVISFKNS